MQELLDYLKTIHSDAETIEPSQDKDYINVVIIMGNSEFGLNAKKEKVIIPMRKTIRYHKDTVRLKMLKELYNIPDILHTVCDSSPYLTKKQNTDFELLF